jgi:hypothetical protein
VVLVYGDRCETARADERLHSIRGQLVALAAMPAGIERHAKLSGALIDAGQLQQGVEDAGAPSDELREFVHGVARALIRSWDSGFAEIGELPATPELALPARVQLKLPEGFAFYAVYPESYVVAARRLKRSGPPRVIGIRSIGTTLGAVVAAALGARPAISVRPFGEPFARQVDLPAEILDAHAHYVIVDEGPGLSGSSFGAVADWLQQRGVPLERIAFLPSHGGGPGPRASEAHRVRWRSAQKRPALFDASLLEKRFGQLEPFSTGSPGERIKFLAWHEGVRVLLKFAGLGAIGERKLDMARALHAAGLTPEPLGLVYGFLVERWEGDARHLGAAEKPIEEIGQYIGTRAKLFPAADDSGATLAELFAMCRRNLLLAFGEETASALDRGIEPLSASSVQRLRTDNKLDRGEWLRMPDGRLLKTDSLDHHCAHDLIGCQDMAWDLAGAIIEFEFDEVEARRLVGSAERAAACSVDASLLDFYRVAYCCFRLGQATLAADSVDGAACDQLRSRAARYETAVIRLLQGNYCCFTRQESLVD